MRHWHAAGVRPLRPLHQSAYICHPCRSRLFSRLAPSSLSLRHSLALFEHNPPHPPQQPHSEHADIANSTPDGPPPPEGNAVEKDGQSDQRQDRGRRHAKSRRASHKSPTRHDKDHRRIKPRKVVQALRVRKISSDTADLSRENALAFHARNKGLNIKQSPPPFRSLDLSGRELEETPTSGAHVGESSEDKESSNLLDSPYITDKSHEETSAPNPNVGQQPENRGTTDPEKKKISDFLGFLKGLELQEATPSPDTPSDDVGKPLLDLSQSQKRKYAPDGKTHQTLKEAMLAARQTSSSLAEKQAPKLSKKARKQLKLQKTVSAKREPKLRSPDLAKLEKTRIREAADLERAKEALASNVQSIKASNHKMKALQVEQPPVPRLFHGLDRVLFNPGVYQLQDYHSKVYNFDPYLQEIMPVTEFDYNVLKEYKTSSQDPVLAEFATKFDKKYVGSTSSMTGTLTHFHYLLSAWRKLTLDMLSREFPDQLDSFTELNRAPNAIFLRRRNGRYAIDADKEFDGANVLMLLGKSMEKLLTMPTSEFERYRKGNSDSISAEERSQPESFHYSTQGDILMRSQLDAYDPRLPGTGMFDLKTRAVVSIRHQSRDYEDMTGYEIIKQRGQYESYEREYYDMMRSTALKYSLQARMGRMDGIFMAFHNVKRIFGFQYMSLNELDQALHGQWDRSLGDREFSLSLELLNRAFNKATEKFPNKSLRFHFETRPAVTLPFMYIFAEPMEEDEIETIQNAQKEKVAEYERSITNAAPKSEDSELDESALAELGSETAKADASSPESTSKPNQPQEQPSDGGAASEAECSPSELRETDSQATKETDAVTSDSSQETIAAPEASSSSSSEVDSNQETATTSESASTEEAQSVEEGESKQDAVTSSETATTQEHDAPEETSATAESSAKEDTETERKPLLAMVLTIRSKVNGVNVERPELLDRSDNWELDYSLTEIPKQERAWELYRQAKGRRRKTYDKLNKADESDPDSARSQWNDTYIAMLRKLSKKGQKMREKMDLAATDQEKVVIGKPYGKAEGKKQEDEEEVSMGSVEDYMKWLYSRGESNSCGEKA